MQKLYCYVDESGQDTVAQARQNQTFIVAVTVFAEDWYELQKRCEEYEQSTGKGRKKWNRVRRQQRLDYIRCIINDEQFRGTLYYSASHHLVKPDFDALTTSTIVRVLHAKETEHSYVAEIYIDGISKKKQTEYSVILRRWGAHVRRVHRARDESSALVRLADALAGLARTAIEGQDMEAIEIIQGAVKRRIITEV